MQKLLRRKRTKLLAAALAFAALTFANGSTANATTTVVQRGETLQDVSKRLYGTTRRWQEILALNKATIKSPNALVVGQTLEVHEAGFRASNALSANVFSAVENDGTAEEMAPDHEIDAVKFQPHDRHVASGSQFTFSFTETAPAYAPKVKPQKTIAVERFSEAAF